jgi:hypothetical protein
MLMAHSAPLLHKQNASSSVGAQVFLQRVVHRIESLNDSLLLLLRSINIASQIFDVATHNGRFPRDSQIKLMLSRIDPLYHYLLDFVLTLSRRDASLLPRDPDYSDSRLRQQNDDQADDGRRELRDEALNFLVHDFSSGVSGNLTSLVS